MKPLRLLGIVAGALVLLGALAVAVAFNSAFQTWAARKAIASQPGVRASVGSVSAGMKRVVLKELRFQQDGAVLTVPSVAVDMPLMTAGWSRRIAVSRLVATDWTLDLTGTMPVPAGPPATPVAPAATPDAPSGSTASEPLPPRVSVAEAAAAARGFAGIFAQLAIPADLSLDGLRLEGNVILPQSRGRVQVTITGGGLHAGGEGTFDVVAHAALADVQVSSVEVQGKVRAAMDTPRSFTKLAAKIDAAARGRKFPEGVTLQADVAATRASTGESYVATVVAGGHDILRTQAEFPPGATKLEGTWKLDVRDADVAPFLLGRPLPAFTAAGEGRFDADARFTTIHVLGKLASTVDRLQVLRAELAPLGELKVSADFDLGGRDGTIVVQKFEAAVQAAEPVATVRALQAFEFKPSSGELRTADATQELVGISLQGVPVGWVQPYLKGIDVAGGRVRGELMATARGGGMTLHSAKPLTVDGVAVAQGEHPLVQGIDLALNASVGYTPLGWQAEIAGLTAKSGETLLLSLAAKAGQLAGPDQPLKATGKLSASLPAVLAQPGAAGTLILTGGDAAADFVVSWGAKQELQAAVELKNLATAVDTNAVKLPAISLHVRADVSPEGSIAFKAPVVLERNERKSDLTVSGTLAPEREKMRGVDAEVASDQLFVDDAQVLAAVLPRPASAPAAGRRDSAPPWAGVHGSLALQLKNVIYSDVLQVSNVTGRLRIDAGMIKLEGLHAGLGEGGRANVSGQVTFDPSLPQPYTLAADIALKEFDPGPLFRALSGSQPATVEGKFDVSSRLAGGAATLDQLADGAGGDFQVTSKGGVFRGLPVNVGNLVDNTSKLGTWLASAGTAISAMTGRKDYAEVANKAQAVAELARGLNPIPYDQLSVVVSRDAALNTTLREFSLISPEMRLSGTGTARHHSGMSLLDDALAMEFTLRARGRQGELLKYLGALEPQTDDLGYAACTVPLRVSGTLGKPDTNELNGRLAALALEKAGVTDKAAELVNKIFGNGK